MAEMQIQVIAVGDIETKVSKAGKGYKAVTLTYKNLSFQGKVESTDINQYNRGCFEKVQKLIAKKSYVVTREKNDGGFWNWTDIQEASDEAVSKASSPAVRSSAPTSSGGRDFETREERQARQVYIVRQSSIGSAIELLSVRGDKKAGASEVIDLAKQFENYVFGNEQEVADVTKGDITTFDDMEDEVL